MPNPLLIKDVRFDEGRPVLCVPVVAADRAAILEKVRTLAEKETQMIEWRADCFTALSDADAVRALLGEIGSLTPHTVVLFTIRTKSQGGRADLTERDLCYRCELAAKSGAVDLIDWEYLEREKPTREIRRLQEMGARVIASHHDFKETPDDVMLRLVMEQLVKSGADMAKLAVMPRTAQDVIRLLALTEETRRQHPDVPLITMSMGELGKVSRIAGEPFGSCVTFGADGASSAPGQMDAKALGGILDALHVGTAEEIT